MTFLSVNYTPLKVVNKLRGIQAISFEFDFTITTII